MVLGNAIANPSGTHVIVLGGMVHEMGVATSYPVESGNARYGMMQSSVRGLMCIMLSCADGDGRWMMSHRSVERGVHSIGKLDVLPADIGNSKPFDPCVVMEKVGGSGYGFCYFHR